MQINILHDICSQRMVPHAAVDTRKYNYITYSIYRILTLAVFFTESRLCAQRFEKK